MVEVLHYKKQVAGVTGSIPMSLDFASNCGFVVDSTSNKNEYQESYWGQRAAAICEPIV
jgi:hypothetical protein